MNVTRNILIDRIKDYGTIRLSKDSKNFAFEMPKLLLNHDLCQDNSLYLCAKPTMLSSMAKQHPASGFLLVLSDDAEFDESNLSEHSIALKTKHPLFQIFNLVQDLCAALQKWDAELNSSVLQNKEIQDLFDLSEEILGNPIVLLDPSMHASAYMSRIRTDDKLYLACVTLGYHPENSMVIFRKNRIIEFAHEEYEKNKRPAVIEPFESSPNKLISYAIPICNHRYYITTMICCNKEPSEGLIELFLNFVSYIAISLNKNIKRQPDDNFFHEYFYTDILDRKLVDKKTIADRARQFNLHDEGFFRLVKIELNTINYAQANWALNDLAARIPTAKAFIYKGAVMAILEFKSGCRDGENVLLSYLKQIELINEEYCANSGVSNFFEHLVELPNQYFQATEAIIIGKILSKKPNSAQWYMKKMDATTMFRYDKLYIYHMIETARKSVSLPELCQKEIIEIIEYDKRHQTDNLGLLYTYLINERKATETAQKLHMHRNNIIYRIQRIEEVFGLDLNDSELRFSLLMTYKILFLFDQIE